MSFLSITAASPTWSPATSAARATSPSGNISAFAGMPDALSGSRAGELQPHDSRNHLFTDADRSVFRATTGIDIQPNGEIVSPIEMSGVDYAAAMRTAGAWLNSRAAGNSGALSAGSLTAMLKANGWSGETFGDQTSYSKLPRNLHA